jgi:hypothetical protein
MSFIIRCGTPDCEWGHKMYDMGEDKIKAASGGGYE